MATITFSVSSTPFSGSKVYTLSDADISRWLTALKSHASLQGDTNPTDAKALLIWAQEVIDQAKFKTRQYELNNAASGILPIGAT